MFSLSIHVQNKNIQSPVSLCGLRGQIDSCGADSHQRIQNAPDNPMFDELEAGPLSKLCAPYGGPAYHSCGKTMEHVVQGYSKVKGLTFAEVGAGSDLAYVRSVLPTLPLNARYSAVNLKHESKEQIAANVCALYTSGKGEEGHLSISCVGIDSNTPDENVRWFLEACSKYNH